MKDPYSSSVSYPIPRRSRMDLSYEFVLSTDIGLMVPVHSQLYVPSDRFKHSQVTLMRAGALVTPVMNRHAITEHAYDVPYRLVWPNSDDFFAEDNDGTPPVVPFINVKKVNKGDLIEYFGLAPVGDYTANPVVIDAFKLAAYFLIWNNYYRAEHVIQEFDFVTLSDGDNTSAYETAWSDWYAYLNPADPPNPDAAWDGFAKPLQRRWTPDPYTSLLPSPQLGDSVIMQIGGSIGQSTNFNIANVVKPTSGGTFPAGEVMEADGADHLRGQSGGIDVSIATNNTTYTLEDVNLPVEYLRLSSALQTIKERMMQGGSRIVEYARNFFGMTMDDLRAHIPVQIGGFKQPIIISEVLQQAPLTDSPDSTPLGTTGGHMISTGGGFLYDRTFKDWGVVIVLMNIQPLRALYHQGVPYDSRLADRYDWPLPQLAHLGEEEVPNSELFIDPDPAVRRMTFGYRPRYGAWKTNYNRVAGEMTDTLIDWVAPRTFAEQPTLSAEFLLCDASKEFMAVVDDPQPFYFHLGHKIDAWRPLPSESTPRLI